jgi:hypothetical protein
MHLEYIDNYDYGRNAEPTTEELLEELTEIIGRDECASEIYDAIYSRALHDIRTSDLAITRIMPDLLELEQNNHRKAMLVMRLLADPFASYSELGSIMGYSKQRVHVVLHELAGRYDWLARFLEMRND